MKILFIALATVSSSALAQERRETYQVRPSSASFPPFVTAEFSEPCDQAMASYREKVLAALEPRRAEIESIRANNPPPLNPKFRRVAMGKTFVRELAVPRTPKTGWQEFPNSWKFLAEDIEKQGNENSADYRWVYLLDDMDSLVEQDKSRIEDGENAPYGHNDGPALLALLRETKACAESITCLEPALSPEADATANRSNALSKLLRGIKSEESPVLKRIFIESVNQYVKAEARFFEFVPNSAVRKISPGQFELPLDAGVFSEAVVQLQGYIESILQDASHSVRIKWEKRELNPLAYFFDLGEKVGGRAYVSRLNKKIMLFPDARVLTIAHEVGHVLGLQDHYFTTWRPDTCEYMDEYNQEDLMSDTNWGAMLPRHWEMLEQTYP